MVTVGRGWKPSSLEGKAGLEVQKYNYIDYLSTLKCE